MNLFFFNVIREYKINKYFRNVCSISFLFSIIFWALSIFRHLLLHSNAYDLGLFDQWIWLASKGEPPYSTMTGLHLFADHGAWTLYIASLVYKVFPSVYILLFSQSFSLCLTSIPLWFLCKSKEISDRNSLLIIVCWLFQPVVFNINLFDFHPEVWAMPLLVLFYLFEKKKKFLLCLLVAFFILGTRDGLVLLVFGLGIEQILKKNFWFGLGLFFTSTIWFIFLNNFAYPALNGDKGTVMALTRYQAYGSNFSQIVLNIIMQPNLLISNIDWEGSLFYLFILFLPVLFFFKRISLQTLAVSLPLLLTNILSESSAQRDLVHQYSLPISLIIIISLINGFKKNNQYFRHKFRLIWILLCWSALAKPWFFTGPYLDRISLIKSSNEAFEMIHKKTNVITTSYLVPHLSQRKLIKFPNNKNQVEADFKKYKILLLNPKDPGWGSSKEIQNYYLKSAKEKGWDCKVWLNGQEFCKKNS